MGDYMENGGLSVESVGYLFYIKREIYFIVKRIFDIICGLVGILFLLPLTIIIKLLYICTGDFHSIFYSQERIGKNGKHFKLYKYRTMVIDAEEQLKKILENPALNKEYKENKKLKNDPRITKCGRVIRKLSLDEFPQFINVFIGNMSLIGNRPYLPREKKDMGNFYDDIIKTKPGITGLWQVSGRSDVSFKRRLELEQQYSRQNSFRLDIKILFHTFIAVFKGDGAM